MQTAFSIIDAKGNTTLHRPSDEDCIYGLITWVREYERATKFPVDILRRFAIGIYQIHQGIDWSVSRHHSFNDTTNKEESYAAAALHFLMVAERLSLNVDTMIDEIHFKHWPKRSMHECSLSILRNISKAQQQLFYADKTNKTKRRDRYNEDALRRALASLIIDLTSLIEPDNRSYAFYLAMEVMTKLN